MESLFQCPCGAKVEKPCANTNCHIRTGYAPGGSPLGTPPPSLLHALRRGDEVRATRDLYGPHRGEQRIIVGRGTRGVITSGGDFYAFAQFGINEIEVFDGEVERV